MRNPILVNHLSPINTIAFNPLKHSQYAIATNARCIIYSNSSVKKTISRFKDTVHALSWRGDGKILVAGDATGTIQLFDVASRSILRTLRGHTAPVRTTTFTKDNTHIISTSDDKTIKHWDIPTESVIHTYTGHEDYIRCGVALHTSPHLFISGSYDHTLKLWDTRTQACVSTYTHGAPVEDLKLSPGNILSSSGGPCVKLWEQTSTSCLHTFQTHQKTVTSLDFDASGSRILTGSLDTHVKVYSMDDFKLVHSVKYPAPILSLALSPDDTRLVVGMSSGLVSIRQRVVSTSDVVKKEGEKIARSGSYAHAMRGAKHKPEETEALKPYDKLIKKFQYANALDSVLKTHQGPVVVVSLLQELIHRDALASALANRDEATLEPLTRFLKRHITNPKFVSVLVDVTNILLDMYAVVINHSTTIDELFCSIKQKVETEVCVLRKIMGVCGVMDCVISQSIA